MATSFIVILFWNLRVLKLLFNKILHVTLFYTTTLWLLNYLLN